MRKFNLKPSVARKMMGLEDPSAPLSAEESREAPQNAGSGEPGGEPCGESLPGVICAWRTDVGRIRKTNQDAVILSGSLFGIADGMGGHNGGETAARGLRDGLLRELSGKEPSGEALLEAVRRVNAELFARQEREEPLRGMGTTLTALWLSRENAYLCQVGDSRAYLLRDCELKQVTEDHSMVADMVRRGILTDEQAAVHPMRNYITRAVGTDETVSADLYTQPRRRGDRWLLCSDGLHGQISRLTLATIAAIPAVETAADRLLEEALLSGGRDNVSLILVDDLTGAPDPETDPVGDRSGGAAANSSSGQEDRRDLPAPAPEPTTSEPAAPSASEAFPASPAGTSVLPSAPSAATPESFASSESAAPAASKEARP